MSIASKLTKLETDISNAYSTISTRGGTIPTHKNTDNLPDAINSIPSGGGVVEPPEKDVNFYTYDGIRTNSYTKAEFLALSAMPASPTYDLLTSQGWNYNLTDAQAYVTECGSLDIGDMAKSSDDSLRIYINIQDSSLLSPALTLVFNGTITVDWGDGTTPETIVKNNNNFWGARHTYSSLGTYEIKVTRANSSTTMTFRNKNNGSLNYSTIICNGDTETNYNSDSGHLEYNGLITKIIVPFFMNMGKGQFKYCYNMESINIPIDALTKTSTYFEFSFYNCRSLRFLSLPHHTRSTNFMLAYTYSLRALSLRGTMKEGAFSNSTLKTFHYPKNTNIYIDGSVFSSSGIQYLVLPSNIVSINSNSITNCNYLRHIIFKGDMTRLNASSLSYAYSLMTMEFPNNTQVPVLQNMYVLGSLPTTCKIIVPDALYESWITAQYWSNYSSQIFKASEV